MSVADLPNWFTVTQAAEHTGLSSTTIRKEISAGNLLARRIGRCLRITDVELRRWMLDSPPGGAVPAGSNPIQTGDDGSAPSAVVLRPGGDSHHNRKANTQAEGATR